MLARRCDRRAAGPGRADGGRRHTAGHDPGRRRDPTAPRHRAHRSHHGKACRDDIRTCRRARGARRAPTVGIAGGPAHRGHPRGGPEDADRDWPAGCDHAARRRTRRSYRTSRQAQAGTETRRVDRAEVSGAEGPRTRCGHAGLHRSGHEPLQTRDPALLPVPRSHPRHRTGLAHRAERRGTDHRADAGGRPATEGRGAGRPAVRRVQRVLA